MSAKPPICSKEARRPTPVSLNRPAHDGEDGKELWETLADKTARVLDAYLDAEAQLRAYPPRAINLAAKKVRGEELTPAEQCCLSRYRRGGPPLLPPMRRRVLKAACTNVGQKSIGTGGVA